MYEYVWVDNLWICILLKIKFYSTSNKHLCLKTEEWILSIFLIWEYNKQIMHKTNTHRHAAAAIAAAAAPLALLLYTNIIYVIFYTHAYKYNIFHNFVSNRFNEKKKNIFKSNI